MQLKKLVGETVQGLEETEMKELEILRCIGV